MEQGFYITWDVIIKIGAILSALAIIVSFIIKGIHWLDKQDKQTEDIEALTDILNSNVFDRPVIKISVYKNRRGRYKGVYLWCKADLGCCRIEPMFCTTWDYELIDINNIKIMIEEESSAF